MGGTWPAIVGSDAGGAAWSGSVGSDAGGGVVDARSVSTTTAVMLSGPPASLAAAINARHASAACGWSVRMAASIASSTTPNKPSLHSRIRSPGRRSSDLTSGFAGGVISTWRVTIDRFG